MIVADNFYLYAKYLYHYKGVEASIDVINQHFSQKTKQTAIKLLGERLKNRPLEKRFSLFDFEVVLKKIFNLPPSAALTAFNSGGRLQTDYATFFIEIWNALPSWQTFTLLDFPAATSFGGYQRQIMEHLYQSVRDGWISLVGYDRESQTASPDYCGRVYMDIIELMTEYDNILGLDLTDLFTMEAAKAEKESSLVHPLDFWEYQLVHCPRKIVHTLIHTLFKEYTSADDTINIYVNALFEAKYFVDASIKAIQILIDTLNKEELDYYPKYAGYGKVEDAKLWLSKLKDVINGGGDISILTGNRLMHLVEF